jgi:DNA-binding MarR family transcriptional regulator
MVQVPSSVLHSSPNDFIGFTIVRLASLLQRRMDSALLSEVGVSVRQFGALSYLADEPDIGSGALARKLLITPQSAGPLVDDLSSQGFVARDDQTQLGTRRAIRLTPKGLDALKRGYAIAERLRADDEMGLDQDQARAVHQHLRKMLNRLSGL